MSVQVVSATDVLLVLLYVKGASGKYNEPIAGTTKLEKFMFLLEQESDLSDIINDEYTFVADDYGPCAHEIFDDIEMLKDANIIEEKKRKLYSVLDEGDSESSYLSSLSYDEEQIKPIKLRVFSLTKKGVKIGKILYDSLEGEQKRKFIILKTLFNKKPARSIVKYVYEKYPKMVTESVIRDTVLA